MVQARERRSRVSPGSVRPSRLPVQRPVSWVVAGLAAGVALGFLLAASFTASVDRESGVPVTLAGGEPPPSTEPAEGLSDLVPGFDFVLISFLVLPSETEMLIWPPGGDPYANPFPAGTWGPRFDAARDSVALAGRGRIGRGNVLYVGNQTAVDPLVTGVLGYAWHDEEPDRLAWNVAWPAAEEGDVFEYRLGELSPRRVLRAAPGQRLVSWGTWGFALQTYGVGAAVQVLDEHGTTIGRSTEGLLLDSTPAGTLLMAGGLESTDVWFTGHTLSGRVLLATASGDTVAGRFNPSGSMIARLAVIDESSYLEIWDSGGTLIDRVEVGESHEAAWSPDSRFVIVAESRPAALAFFDRVDRSLQRVAVDETPQAVIAR